MSASLIQEAIGYLTYGRITPEAIDRLAKSFDDAYSHMREVGFPATEFFEKEFKKILEKRGLMDAWISYLIISFFTEGIAIGLGKDKITVEDVEKAEKDICDRWPKCDEERVRNSLKALSALLRTK
jgi:hypothetical protein